MIPYTTIATVNPLNFYSEYELSEDELALMVTLTEDGYEQEALDMFLDEFLQPAATKYKDVMTNYLSELNAGPMRNKEQDNLIRSISLLSLGLSSFLSDNFKTFIKNVYAGNVFDKAEITDSELKRNIQKEVIAEFEQLIGATMSQTQSFILNSVRTLQREMVAENLFLKNSDISGDALEAEIIRFKEALQVKYPGIYKAMRQGNIMTTVKFADGQELTRHYKLDYYIDLTVRTTLLNVDRNANMIAALTNGERVMEFYKADNRNVQKDREICQDILTNLVNGVSILALDEEAAKILGVMTVDEAKSTPDYFGGAGCRHSLKRCSANFIAYINERLKNGN